MSVPTADEIRKVEPRPVQHQPPVLLQVAIPTSGEMRDRVRPTVPTASMMPYQPPDPPVNYEKEYIRNCYGRFDALDEYKSIT